MTRSCQWTNLRGLIALLIALLSSSWIFISHDIAPADQAILASFSAKLGYGQPSCAPTIIVQQAAPLTFNFKSKSSRNDGVASGPPASPPVRLLPKSAYSTSFHTKSHHNISSDLVGDPRLSPWSCLDGGGLVVVITRSVVTPKKRPMRLLAIAETWAAELAARGASVVVLTGDLKVECAPLSGAFEKAADAEVARLNNSTRLTKPTARVPGLFECLSPPVSLDLTKDKAAIFTWLVELLMKDSQRSRSTGSISNELNLREPLKCLFWCNDHTFIVPSNLIAYTRSKAISSSYPLYAGKELKSGGRNFNSGAAGILLNRWSLGILMGHWKRPKDHPECFPPNLQDRSARPLRKIANNTSFGKVREPGLLLADCLYLAGIRPNHTRDGLTEDRFHAYGPQRLVAGTYDEWYKNYHAPKQDDGRELGKGLDCCSKETASFHYVEAPEARAIHEVLRDPAKFRAMHDAARRAQWPRGNELSYSSPPGPNDPMWEFLAEKMVLLPCSAPES
mmetsp:Transcript_48695/g.110519  ORF Transcript_48695/g.110519 Transcript_48695/m.110519 type:complete len:507 (+) Transcript_48695:64-1584(+)